MCFRKLAMCIFSILGHESKKRVHLYRSKLAGKVQVFCIV